MKDFSYDAGHVPFIEFVHVISTLLFFFSGIFTMSNTKGPEGTERKGTNGTKR